MLWGMEDLRCFFWYGGYELQRVGTKSGMQDWQPPLVDPHLKTRSKVPKPSA